MEHNSRMKEITGNLKQDVKDLLGESASLFTGFFKRGACTVRAVADKWKAFAHDISAAVDDLMKPPFAEGGPEAPMVSLDPEGEPTPAARGLKSPLKLREDNREALLCILSTQTQNDWKKWKS